MLACHFRTNYATPELIQRHNSECDPEIKETMRLVLSERGVEF
jgi:hypothetical protein